MGEVYKARDTRLDRIVALKILSPEIASSADARQRFEREAKTISQLSHPHICALYDVGRHDDTEYLVMEFLEGDTLADRLAKGPLALDLALRYAIQMADALDKAHRQGIVHRDLKPANVMITKSGVKLLDFGLAKASMPLSPAAGSVATVAAPTPLTGRGVIAGTVHYMAPEQLEGRTADARSDIYAFGAVIYEMVTATQAFRAAMRTLAPPALDRLVRSCVAVDPDERWQSAHDVALQLAAIDAERVSPPARSTTPRGAWGIAPWALAATAITVAVTGDPVRVTAGGGNLPRWSRDGRELFYVSADLHLVAVPVRTAPSLSFGAPQPLFAVSRAMKWDDAKTTDAWPDFDVSADGRFLAIVPEPANHEPLTAVLNWHLEASKP